MDEGTPRKEVLMRLRRIGGQVRGLEKMVAAGAPCPEVLTQVAAVTAAVKKAGQVMVQGYLQECLEQARKQKGKGPGEPLKELQQAIARYIDWA